MTDFLVKRFVKDYEDIEKVSVRTAYGVLASLTGIFCNDFFISGEGKHRPSSSEPVGSGRCI